MSPHPALALRWLVDCVAIFLTPYSPDGYSISVNSMRMRTCMLVHLARFLRVANVLNI